MVQTRNQWNLWANRGFRNTQSSQGSSQGSERNSYSFENNYSSQGSNHAMDTPNPASSLYGPNDHCKRHRVEDGEPKTEEVTSYRRRKPV